MRVALVTSEGRCGIAEHSAMLRQYVQAADPEIEFITDPRWLDPIAYKEWYYKVAHDGVGPDLLHLNYHRGLHSRWTPGVTGIGLGPKVVITFHDTYETQPDRLPWELLDACDAMIVHEPCDLSAVLPHQYDGRYWVPGEGPDSLLESGLRPKVHYWRQGVPAPSPLLPAMPTGFEPYERPYVGTCGFAFPWKGFELLCDAARLAGWGVLICSHNATDEQVRNWRSRNPWVAVDRNYYPTGQLVTQLMQCDATAFLYSCANSGTSGAIRLGIAAGKPLLRSTSRQFRDLDDPDAYGTSRVLDLDVENVASMLQCCTLQRFDPAVVRLREQDSWEHLGKKYAALYRSLVAGGLP